MAELKSAAAASAPSTRRTCPDAAASAVTTRCRRAVAGEPLARATSATAACNSQPLGADKPSADCKTFLDGSEKAAAQWELERRFRVFEAKF